MTEWLLAFALTVLVELPLVAACAGVGRRRRAAGDSVFVNLLTHPLAYLAVTSGALPWSVTELVVTVGEALLYRSVTRLPRGRAWLTAVVANGTTAALSFVV